MTTNQDEWSSVSVALLKNPYDFKLWQKLVYSAESQNGLINKNSNQVEIENLRKSYESFLSRYPFLLRYWMSYALWERRLDHNDKAAEIFLRALRFGGYDVTLWVTYLKFKIETLTNNIGDILKLFEAARQNIGYNYQSFEFYSLYLEFLNTYADQTNNFRKKSIMLLRIMLEVPLYNFSAAYEKIFDFVSSKSSTIDDFSQFMHASNLAALKKSSQNNKKVIQEQLEKVVADAYVVNQSKSFELFGFERSLVNNESVHEASSISLNQIETWANYLNFVEYTYPFDYVMQLYERALLSTCNHQKIISKYVDYCVIKGKLLQASNILCKTMPSSDRSASVWALLRLIDLEIATGSVLKAKDLISKYISVNSDVPNSVFEKLMQIEAFIKANDEDHLCTLTHEIIVATKSPIFLEKLTKLPVSDTKQKEFFLRFVGKGKTDSYIALAGTIELSKYAFFWAKLRELCDDSDLEGITFPQPSNRPHDS
ncbi:hypothetical protein OXX80_004752 [Metschnikowia pulcherrima]